jgi:tetratricopeptide (TPR) repeat protein
MPAKDIKELRQSGRLEEALAMAQNELNAQPDNIWGKRNISWVYYEYIKKYAHAFDYEGFIENLTKLKALNLPENEVMVFDTAARQIASAVFTLQKSEPVDYSKINQVLDLIKAFHLK